MSFPIQGWNAQAESAKITIWDVTNRTWTLNTERPGLHFLQIPWSEFSQHSKPFSLHLLHPFSLSGVPSQTQMIWPHILTAQEHISVTTITTLSVMKSINYSCEFVRILYCLVGWKDVGCGMGWSPMISRSQAGALHSYRSSQGAGKAHIIIVNVRHLNFKPSKHIKHQNSHDLPTEQRHAPQAICRSGLVFVVQCSA